MHYHLINLAFCFNCGMFMIGLLAKWFHVFVVPFETLILYMYIILIADYVLIALFFLSKHFPLPSYPLHYFYLVVAIRNTRIKSCTL
jgi:hypothetical protein